MNLCAIQSPYPYTLAEADDAVEFLIRELDRCDSSADLILLPEYSNAPTVFPEGECIPYAAAHTERLINAAVQAAKRCNAVVAVNYAAEVDGGYRNTTRVFDRQGRIAGDYYKQHLPHGETAVKQMDGRYVPSTYYPAIVEVDGLRLGFLTCYDCYFSEFVAHIAARKPDIVLVHGDTSTAFAASLAAFYQQIPVGHVEAGLRTYNMNSPYPEEFNRQAIGLTASLHFAPTQKAADALLKEGKDPEQIFVTGNTGIDALHYTVRNDFYHPETEWAKDSRLIAVTAHRRENLGEPMRDMFRAIRRIVEEFADVKVIYPVHLNPQVRKIADEEFGRCERIHLIEPLDVVEFHNLMKASYLIMTDSGGIQEEAPALGKPVLVMRDTTERPEGVEAGTLKLAGTKMDDIYRECRRLLTEPEIYRRMSEAKNPYGDGTASIKIRKILEDMDA